MSLLLDAGELGVALIDDHVEQRVAHLLRRHLAQVLPFALAFEVAELYLFGFDRAVKRVEFEAGDLITIDADLLAPFIKETDPVGEGTDFRYFAGHDA